MRVCGLDICKGWAVAWILEDIPDNIKDDYQRGKLKRSKKPDQDEFTFYFCHDQYEKVTKPGTKSKKIQADNKIKQGIETFLSWKPDLVVLEPTGLHYSLFISKVCEKHGIQVRWISHDVCKSVRITHKLHDKTDLADAYILAIQGVIYGHKPSYWIRFENGNILRLRDLYHFSKHITALSVQTGNRTQQHLALEFPETVALFKDCFSRNQDTGRSSLIATVAGRKVSTKQSPWVNRLDNSIAREYGVKVSAETCYLAMLTDDFHLKLTAIDEEFIGIVNSPQFSRYNAVFDEFMFGVDLRAIILILAYPFNERFANIDLPISRKIAKFKRRLGMAKVEYESGISVKGDKKGSSSALARSEFYIHVCSRYKLLSRREGFQHPTAIMRQIQEYHDDKEAELRADPEKLQKRWEERQKAKIHAAHLSYGLSVAESQKIITSMDWTSKAPNAIEKTRLIGDLLIMRTGAYLCKQLFKALLDVGPDLDS